MSMGGGWGGVGQGTQNTQGAGTGRAPRREASGTAARLFECGQLRTPATWHASLAATTPTTLCCAALRLLVFEATSTRPTLLALEGAGGHACGAQHPGL